MSKGFRVVGVGSVAGAVEASWSGSGWGAEDEEGADEAARLSVVFSSLLMLALAPASSSAEPSAGAGEDEKSLDTFLLSQKVKATATTPQDRQVASESHKL